MAELGRRRKLHALREPERLHVSDGSPARVRAGRLSGVAGIRRRSEGGHDPADRPARPRLEARRMNDAQRLELLRSLKADAMATKQGFVQWDENRSGTHWRDWL